MLGSWVYLNTSSQNLANNSIPIGYYFNTQQSK